MKPYSILWIENIRKEEIEGEREGGREKVLIYRKLKIRRVIL